MKKVLFATLLAGLCLAQASHAVSINTSFGILRNGSNAPMPDGGLLMLIASDNATFGTPSVSAFTTEADDVELKRWSLDSSVPGLAGGDEFTFSFNIGAAETLQGGEKLLLMWFPGLTTAALAPGNSAEFGTFRSDSPALGDAWVVPGDNGVLANLALNTDSYFGGPSPDSAGVANQITEAGEVIPEPSTALLAAMGILGLSGVVRRRR